VLTGLAINLVPAAAIRALFSRTAGERKTP
jgi:hypothetical protein